MTTRTRARRLVALVALLALAALLAPPVGAERLDPSLPLELSLDPATSSSRTSRHPVPRAANVGFRIRAASALGHAPVISSEQTVVLAHADPVLAEYDARGRRLWAAPLGPAPAAASPLVFADGTRVVVTEGGELLGFSKRGRLRLRRRLPFGTIGDGLVVEPTLDGGLVLAEGEQLVRLDASFELVLATRLGVPVRALLRGATPGSRELWAVGSGGSVLAIAPDGGAALRARFSGAVGAVARLDEHRLLAVLDRRRLVELDLRDQTERVRAEPLDLELSSVLAVTAAGEVRLVASDFLLAFDRDFAERFRVALGAPGAAPGQLTAAELLVDREGTALVVGSGIGSVRVTSDGELRRIEGATCPEPLRPAALRPGSVVVACRSGLLLRLDAVSQPAGRPAQ